MLQERRLNVGQRILVRQCGIKRPQVLRDRTGQHHSKSTASLKTRSPALEHLAAGYTSRNPSHLLELLKARVVESRVVPCTTQSPGCGRPTV